MKLKKIMAFILTFSVLCCAACGSDPDGPGNKGELSGSIVLGVPIGGSEGTELQAVIDAYMELHPKVDVKLKYVETSNYTISLKFVSSATITKTKR